MCADRAPACWRVSSAPGDSADAEAVEGAAYNDAVRPAVGRRDDEHRYGWVLSFVGLRGHTLAPQGSAYFKALALKTRPFQRNLMFGPREGTSPVLSMQSQVLTQNVSFVKRCPVKRTGTKFACPSPSDRGGTHLHFNPNKCDEFTGTPLLLRLSWLLLLARQI